MTTPSTETLEAEQASFDATSGGRRRATLTSCGSAETVAALRGSVTLPVVSSPSALKLWDLLRAHHRAGTAELMFGVTDPVALS
ncbi:hypothetical protein SCUCBS95973_008373 [Sporothrix curviconia]|uniref:methylisocitrate lyase n=1 Tax=Sporothrix curviconia TaxID=1260050 RepID=A0ABP0CL19_9PEZI